MRDSKGPTRTTGQRGGELGRRGVALAAQACAVVGWGGMVGGLVQGQSVLVMSAAEELKTGHLGAVHQPLPRSWKV